MSTRLEVSTDLYTEILDHNRQISVPHAWAKLAEALELQDPTIIRKRCIGKRIFQEKEIAELLPSNFEGHALCVHTFLNNEQDIACDLACLQKLGATEVVFILVRLHFDSANLEMHLHDALLRPRVFLLRTERHMPYHEPQIYHHGI